MRLHALDYLRGMAAFSIMMYHYLMNSYGEYGPDTFLGKLGIYGVSIFYILSGLTLYWVYSNHFILKEFIVKRIFRIFPLLWLVTLIVVVLNKFIIWEQLILNLTGLFGFVSPDQDIAVGAWSIGNELFFYALFPFLILAKNRKVLIYFLGLLLIAYLTFAFFILNRFESLADQWTTYVNPMNQAFFFALGFGMGHYSKKEISQKLAILIMCAGVGAFIFYPVDESAISAVTGVNRIVFTLISALICFGFYKFTLLPSNLIHKPLAMLGTISYSAYLLHPVIWRIARKLDTYYNINSEKSVKIIVCVIVTMLTSFIIYHLYEKKFIKLGSKFIHRYIKKDMATSSQ